MTNTYTDTEKQLIINDITDVDISTVTFNADELYLTPDNAVYSVNNVAPVNGNVTLDIANKDLSNLSTTGNAKFQAPITGGASTITSSNLTASRALISNSSGKVAVSAVTSAQLGYLSTVTSNVQTQLNGKQATLVSGTNIKTINGTSILGSGNITTGTVTSVNNVEPVDGNVTISIPTVDQTYDATSINAQSGVAIAGAKFLKNNSTNTAGTSYIIGGTSSGVSNAVCVGSGTSTTACSVVVGQGASSTALYSTAIGSTADSNSQFCTAIGYAAKARATSAIQLGTGTNTDSNTLSIGFSDAATNYQLLDGTTGFIPDARLSTNIQRTLVSGTSIKTINSTSLLGNGNIDTSEIFIAEYGTTTYAEVSTALANGKVVYCNYTANLYRFVGTFVNTHMFSEIDYYSLGQNASNPIIRMLYLTSSGWISWEQHIAKDDLSNVTSIDSNSAVQTALDDKADTTLSNVTSIDANSAVQTELDAKADYRVVTTLLNGKANTSLSNLNSTGQAVLDGQWVGTAATLCQGRTSETSNDKSFDVSAYVPSDGNNYEVLLTGAVTTGTTSGNQARINLTSSIISDYIVICNAQTRTSSGVTAYGACTLAIGTDREVIVQGWANNTGAYSLYLRGYRRIGTNS